jgi:carbamoylphosphate synthase large subunit
MLKCALMPHHYVHENICDELYLKNIENNIKKPTTLLYFGSSIVNSYLLCLSVLRLRVDV